MVNPQTVNVGLIVPLTGADVDTWGEDDVNPDFVAIDGLIGGVQQVSLSNVPVTLTSPAGFTPTPGAGPTQSQNRVLRFTGTLSADVTVTLPIPGSYLCENLCTGAFNVILRGVTATEVVALPPGEIVEIYNDGANVRFVGLGRMGVMEHWSGISAMPAWVGACTKLPYLPCDNVTTYNIADFTFLGNRYLGKFGGNGITTFKTPDMGGRVPLAYDYTGTRITVGGCGINGQTLGASQDKQTNILVNANLPPYTPAGTVATVINNGTFVVRSISASAAVTGPLFGGDQLTTITATSTFTGTPQGGTSTPVNNVQPAIVTGIWVVKT